THGHPYATQELCYSLWEETPERQTANAERYDAASTKLLRSEHAHFGLIWDKAAKAQRLVLQGLAAEGGGGLRRGSPPGEPGRPLSRDYRRRHGLPGASSVQRALEALVKEELVARAGPGAYRIAGAV